MIDIRSLVDMLERKFRHTTNGAEKYHLLNLLRIYYPMLQKNVLKTIEVSELKSKLKALESECLHLNTTKEPSFTYIYKCDDCGATIYM